MDPGLTEDASCINGQAGKAQCPAAPDTCPAHDAAGPQQQQQHLQQQQQLQQQQKRRGRGLGFLSALPNKEEAVRQFTPSWFTVTMGTGSVALSIMAFPFHFPGLYGIGMVVWSFNVVLFVLFSCMLLGRLLFFSDTIKHLIRHPNQSLFVGAVPMSFSTITNGVVTFLIPRHGVAASHVAQVLFWVNLPAVCLCVVLIPFSMFSIHTHVPASMTALWLLPVVPACVAANTAGLVARMVPDEVVGMNIASIGLVLMGIGFLLSYQITGIYYNRLTCHNLPAREVIVSSFLPVGPMAMTAMALTNLAIAAEHHLLPYMHTQQPDSPFDDGWLEKVGRIVVVGAAMVALSLWGFAVWWLALAVSCIADTVRQGIPFNLGWWGSVFPFGVVSSATCLLAAVLSSSGLRYLGAVAVCLHVLLWLVVVALTAQKAWLGQLFHAPCLAAAAAAAAAAGGAAAGGGAAGGNGYAQGGGAQAGVRQSASPGSKLSPTASQALSDLEDKLDLTGSKSFIIRSREHSVVSMA